LHPARGIVAVKDLNLRIEPGEVFGLLGPNGSGKSTTLKIILGLVSPTHGRTEIFGRDSRLVESREAVGFLPENPYFYKYLSGEETLRFFGRLCGLGGARLKEQINELIELVGLTRARKRRLGTYSKGMLQRIGLAQALIHDPRLVILDEPTAGVDPAGSREIRDLILDLKRRGITVLLSSHLLAQAQEICDRVGILADGVLVREGHLQELIAIENQTELVIADASTQLVNEIESVINRSNAKLIECRKSTTTLERLFLEATAKNDEARMSNDEVKMTNESASTLQRFNASTLAKPYRAFSIGRISAITLNTLTELTRLRVFYVLLVFALLLIGSSIFMAQFSFQQEFQILKDVSLGAISIFTSLLAIVATARLLPQDIEDRTVYTILAKPVPRFEYVLGKIAGVLLLLAISTLVMSAAFLLVLFLREQAVIHATLGQMAGAPPEQLADALRAIRSSALNIDIFPGIIIIYLKACLLAALTLFVSTFATTNIFTIVVMAFIYFIGHLQATAREYWLQEHSSGLLTRVFLAIVALLFPDLQAFNLVDDIVAGTAISMAVFAKTALLGIFYTTIYTLLAAFVFYGKEL
jgi:ABC-2 type transport system ATP-binding protein